MSTASRMGMIANPVIQASDRSGAFGDGTNATEMLNFTLTNVSKVNVLPVAWHGRYVRMRPVGADMNYYFTFDDGATIAASPAASDAGASAATQGERVPDGELFEVKVPWPPSGGRVYFARLGSVASQSVQVVLADGTVGVLEGG